MINWIAYLGASALFMASTAACASGSHAVFMRENDAHGKQIWKMDIERGNIHPLTKGDEWHLYPEISSDGRQVVFVAGAGAESLSVRVLDTERKIEERWSTPGVNLHPDFSGDGRFLAWSGPYGEGGREAIALIDLALARKELVPNRVMRDDGHEVLTYTTEPKVIASEGKSYFPALSSDGSFLVFQRSNIDGSKEIVEYSIATAKLKILPTSGVKSMSPALSFDDRKVAYTSLIDGNWDIYVLDRQSGVVERLTTNPAQDFAPTFTLNGDVIFASNRAGRFGLYRLTQLDGTWHETEVHLDAGADLYAPSVSGSGEYSQAILPRMPEPARSSFGAVQHRGKIYIAGGHQGPEHTYPPESFVSQLEWYDFASGTWHRGADRSVPSQGFELIAYGDYLYAFGGFAFSPDHKPGWRSLDLIERYDIRADKWEIIGQMPRKRSSHVVAVVGMKAYLMGGWDATPRHENDTEGTFHRAIDVFDLETGKMEVTPYLLPDPLRRAFTAVERDGKILLLGGLGVGASHFELLDQVTEFDPATGIWRELPKLPFGTFAPAAGVMDGEIYVFGGMFREGQWEFSYVNHIFRLGAETAAQWTHTGRYLSETKGFAMVVDLGPGRLGILGGHSYENNDSPVPTFELFRRK